MSTWTDAAKAALGTYFERLTPSLRAGGADPAEVTEDLRRHLDREIAAENLACVTEADVQRLLNRIGAPPADAPAPSMKPLAPPDPSPPKGPEPRPGIWLFTGGIILPVAALLIELGTRMCAATFFDPLPTWGHVTLVTLVPIVNAIAWFAASNPLGRPLTLVAWGNGLAAGVALFYSILFLPLLLPGIFAVVVFGWGLLPWSPLLALASTIGLRRHLRRVAAAALPRLWPAIVTGFALVAGFEVPGWATRVGLDLATSEDPVESRRGISLLRSMGDESSLLRACYGRGLRAAELDLTGLLFTGGRDVSPDQARTTYYRVTGRAFNAVPAPRVRTGRGDFAPLEEWTWDEDQGGEQVGGRLRGLSLRSSRLDAQIDADSAIGYCEWVMEFRNDAPRAQEARTQILLPPGGVISRLTLWINGEEREAAFAGRSQVREAYQNVAIRQRRDPVLVTTAGPDRVLVQCFPVPQGGGTMRIRIGVTCPLQLPDTREALFVWPRLLERNFSIAEEFRHTLWLEAPGSTIHAAGSLNTRTTSAQGELSERQFVNNPPTTRLSRQPSILEAWTHDSRAAGPQIIRQQIIVTNSVPLELLVIAIDSSQSMASDSAAVVSALATLPPSLKTELVVADDEPEALDPRSETNAALTPVELASRLNRISFAGGRDNLPALVRAWDRAAASPRSAVLWIHGPQPVLLNTTDALRQRYERRPEGPPIHAFQTRGGPNRIMENLDALPAILPAVRLASVDQDLRKLLERLSTNRPEIRLERSAEPASELSEAPGRRKASFQLARLWARDEINRRMRHRMTQQALQLAGNYQLVTPWSGAVVLETLQQFAAAGLQPVDATTVPSVPEPSTITLGFIGGAVLLWALRRPRRRHKPCSAREGVTH